MHIEVDDSLNASDIHALTRKIVLKIYEEFSIILTVGIYARNDKYKDIRSDIEQIASEYEEVLEVHGFLVNEEMKTATFDIIVDFDADREKVKKEILEKIKAKHPEFDYYIIDDYDVSD